MAAVPTVTPAYRDRRRRQILDAAATCFARNGFHQTTVDDLLAEAGLSAGALYRYFRGKDEIIAAIAREALGAIAAEVSQLLAEEPVPTLAESLRRVLALIDSHFEATGYGPIGVQVWAEAQRDPALAQLVRQEYGAMRERFVALARHAADGGLLPAGADVEAVGQALFGAVPGYIVQTLLLGTVDVDRYLAGWVSALTPTGGGDVGAA